MFHAIEKIVLLFGTKRETGHIVSAIPTPGCWESTFSSAENSSGRTIFANV
jgi:hypothetical protein